MDIIIHVKTCICNQFRLIIILSYCLVPFVKNLYIQSFVILSEKLKFHAILRCVYIE